MKSEWLGSQVVRSSCVCSQLRLSEALSVSLRKLCFWGRAMPGLPVLLAQPAPCCLGWICISSSNQRFSRGSRFFGSVLLSVGLPGASRRHSGLWRREGAGQGPLSPCRQLCPSTSHWGLTPRNPRDLIGCRLCLDLGKEILADLLYFFSFFKMGKFGIVLNLVSVRFYVRGRLTKEGSGRV